MCELLDIVLRRIFIRLKIISNTSIQNSFCGNATPLETNVSTQPLKSTPSIVQGWIQLYSALPF